MNKTELTMAVAEKAGLSKKDAAAAVNAVLDVIGSTLAAGEKVSLPGFGNFEVKTRAERQGRNPVTKETVMLPAAKRPSFKAGKNLKDLVSK